MCTSQTAQLLFGLLLVATIAVAVEPAVEDEAGLTLLVTSGSSGRLFTDDATIASLAATIQAAAKEAKAETRDVVILDAGRTLLPYAESRFDGGTTMFEVLKAAGCTVFTPAPIDYALGIDTLRELAADSKIEVVRPFTLDSDGSESTLVESTEVKTSRGPVLEILSLMAPEYADDLAATGIDGAIALEPPASPSSTGRIRIAMVHSRGRGNHLASRDLTWQLVAAPGGLDVLFDPDLGSDVVLRSVSAGRPVVLAGRDQDSSRPWTVARLDLDTKFQDGRWKITAADLRVIDVDLEAPLDPKLVSVIDQARERFLATQAQSLGAQAPRTRNDLERFILQSLRERARSEVAILNRGALRPVAEKYFQTENLTRETVMRLLSFDQYLVTGQLSGAEIEALADASVKRVEADGSPRMSSLLFEGVTFDIKNEGTSSATVGNVRVNGRPIRTKDSYTVITNHYLASGGDEYPIIAAMPQVILHDDADAPVELRAGIVLPRIEEAQSAFVDLHQRALWHWGIDRASLGFYTVTTDRDPEYDDVSDSRARADDSMATLAELRAFVEREKPSWTWENLLWGRYGVLDLEGAERRETDDHLRLETSAVLTRATFLGGHPYSSLNIITEFDPGEDSEGATLSRRFEQSLTAGMDWTTGNWPRIRLGLSARNYSHIDRDPQVGVTAEAFYKRDTKGWWPAIDAHFVAEYLAADDSDVSRFDFDLRLPFPIYGQLAITPAFNYYIYDESIAPGSAKFFRFSLNLSYSWAGKHQSW